MAVRDAVIPTKSEINLQTSRAHACARECMHMHGVVTETIPSNAERYEILITLFLDNCVRIVTSQDNIGAVDGQVETSIDIYRSSHQVQVTGNTKDVHVYVEVSLYRHKSEEGTWVHAWSEGWYYYPARACAKRG